MLVSQLPADSATVQAELGVRYGWEYTQELLAQLLERVDQLTALTHVAWFKPPHPRPVPVWRPWQPTDATVPAVERRMPSELLDLAMAGITS